MLSVTKRISSVSQPKGGFVPRSLFKVENYEDYYEIVSVEPALASIQGLAVDYLTRFMYSKNKFKAFAVSIKGAQAIDHYNNNNDETNKISVLLNEVNGLDEHSILNVCKIVCYDTAIRAGVSSYQSPENIEWDERMFKNIKILVERGLTFFEKYGPIILEGFTFEGGYTGLVTSGDGDYLTDDMIIDFKVSKKEFSIEWSLQLLAYYILGFHSYHEEFQGITKLCIFNPLLNKSYICNINNIKDKSKYTVSNSVLGYKMKFTESSILDKKRKTRYGDKCYATWKQIDGTDNKILNNFHNEHFVKNDFKVDNYGDGIFDISINDYWTFLQTTIDEYNNQLRPKFPHTESFKLIKRNSYYMFISVSPKGKNSILHGARLHRIDYPLEYYYDNIEQYANAVIKRFKKYWDTLGLISKQIQLLEPSKKFLRSEYNTYLANQKFWGLQSLSYNEWCDDNKEWYKCSGKIHGCIVDIDMYNHIYVNPSDGKITPYHAFSMYDKDVYQNTKSLISSQKPELMNSLNNLLTTKKKNNEDYSLLVQDIAAKNLAIISQEDEINDDSIKVYDYDMYEISNKLKPLQNIYDINLVQVWYDDFLNTDKLMIETKYGKKTNKVNKAGAKYINQSMKQKNGLSAIVINYRNRDDIDVQFEDCEIVEHVSIDKWKKGTVAHPNIQCTFSKPTAKDKYIGMSRKMNCGLTATIIEYFDSRNITVQFEDGLIRKGIRTDHFMNGKVSHN